MNPELVRIIRLQTVGFDEVNRNFRQLQRTTASTATAMQQVDNSGRRTRAVFQNLSFQVADFAVVMGQGQGALRAISQQGSQAAAALSLLRGPIGAIGLTAAPLIAILFAVGDGFQRFARSSRDTASAFEEISAASSALTKANERLAESTAGVTKELAGNIAEVRDLLQVRRELAEQEQASLISDTLSNFLDQYRSIVSGPSVADGLGVSELAAQLASTIPDIDRVRQLFAEVQESAESADYTAAASSLNQIRNIMDGQVAQYEARQEAGERLAAAERQILDTLRQLAPDLVPIEEALRAAAAAGGDLGEQSKRLAEGFKEARDVINGSLTPLQKVDEQLRRLGEVQRELSQAVIDIGVSDTPDLERQIDLANQMVDVKRAIEILDGQRVVLEREAADELQSAQFEALGLADAMREAERATASLAAQTEAINVRIVAKTAELVAAQQGLSREAAQLAGETARIEATFRSSLATTVGPLSPEQQQTLDSRISQARELSDVEQGLNDIWKSRSTIQSGGGGGGGSAAMAEGNRQVEEAISLIERLSRSQETAEGRALRLAEEYRTAQGVLLEAGVLTSEQFNQITADILSLTETGQEAADRLSGIGQVISGGITSGFDDLIKRTDSVAEAFGDMVTDILSSIAKLLVSQQINRFLGLLGQQQGFGFLGAQPATGQIAGQFASAAIGAVPALFSGGGSQPQQYVTGVQSVPRGGRGLGEAGGGQAAINIINNAQNVDVTPRQTGGGGVELVIENSVKNMMRRGALDSTMSTNYGIRRRPR